MKALRRRYGRAKAFRLTERDRKLLHYLNPMRGPDHNEKFYTALKKLIAQNHMPWKVAYELEAYNCHAKH